MEIRELKRQLSMIRVLAHYGLKPDGNGRLHCPFHGDKTPSMQVYERTGTFCCFSTNCSAGTGDVIDFIGLMEKCNKHEAIMKAKQLLTGQGVQSQQPPVHSTAKLYIASPKPPSTEVLAMFFAYCKKALPLTKKATAYLNGRDLDYKQHEVGFNSGGLHGESKNHHLVSGMSEAGLLKPRPAGGYSVWAKDCIIFPLRNKENEITSLYGRSITDNQDSRHFYTKDRTGLYPGYPTPETKRLILTESVIDAASLLQQPAIKENYTVLTLYGTNALMDEHQQAIIALENLEEVIFMLDGDEAGNKAVTKHHATLQQLLPEVKFTKVSLPGGEDVNSVLQSHENAAVLSDLIESRQAIQTDFSFSMEETSETTTDINPSAITATPQLPKLPANNKLNTSQAELLIYTDAALRIEVLGGIKIAGLDRMKVTLKLTHAKKPGLPLWHSLDLYNHGHREQLLNLLADSYDMNVQTASMVIAGLTTELEAYRLQRIEALQPKKETGVTLTVAQKEQAINELKKANLLERTKQLLAASGIVGESTNALIAYLVYSTRKQPIPLHVMFLGASGSGKTHLQESVSELIPEEDRIEITQITENALYYFKQDELKHKLLLIEDLDGAEAVFYPLRELQTKRRISKTVTLKDNKGNLKTITLTVEGPVCVSGCTTKEKIYEDNANRCLLLYIDQGRDQDRRITKYQTMAAAGEINRVKEQQYRELFRNMQRLLKPVRIINPYAKHIELPEQVFKPRRTMTLLLGFIEAVTFYHQYQRQVKKDKDGGLYIESTPEDIAAAFELLKEVLFSKSDELAKATRNFFEHLKSLLLLDDKDSFTSREIRERLRMNPSNLKRYLLELERYGYVKRTGNRYRSYEYTITNPEEYEVLKSSIDGHLQAIVEKISGSVVQ